MRRIAHGSTSVLDFQTGTVVSLEEDAGENISPPVPPKNTPFRYLFENLQDAAADALLPQAPGTLEHLASLGAQMCDKQQAAKFNSTIPSAYTYFGQFVDHDISQTVIPKADENTTDSCELDKANLAPWTAESVVSLAKNERSDVLELDCIYGGEVPRDGPYLSLAKVIPTNYPIKVADPYHDLIRKGRNSEDRSADRAAVIADRRNDSNLIVSQLHVAFLRAHNRIVEKEHCTFEEAQTLLRQHYHWVVIHDFLEKRIADPDVFKSVISDPHPRYNPTADYVYLPLEFTVAAYRFGHSMIRNTYYLNTNYPGVFLLDLFVLCVLSDGPVPTPGKGYDQIPDKRIVDWNFFLTGDKKGLNLNFARKIRTQIADPLFTLLDEKDEEVPCEKRLAVQDLKRGYMLRMPTGQAVAKELGYDPLTPAQIWENAGENQRETLQKAGFLERTPLWFYVLVEATAQAGGNRLGKVGSRIVAEVLIGLVRKSPDSFLKIPGYSPRYAEYGAFDLPDLLKLAGVL